MDAEIYPELEWRQMGPKRWERGVDEIEEFYHTIAQAYAGTGRMFFGMTGFITCSVPVGSHQNHDEVSLRVDDALRQAWLRLRLDNPTLASWVEYDSSAKKLRKTYQSCSDKAAQDDWMRKSFKLTKIELSDYDWANNDPPAPRIPTLFVLDSAQDREQRDAVKRSLVLRSPHEIIDGMGSLRLLDNLFRHASQVYPAATPDDRLEFDDEASKLSPAFRTAAQIPHTMTDDQSSRLQQTLRRNQTLRDGATVSTLPFHSGPTLPGVHKRIAVTLSSDHTVLVSAACKKLGATVTHAFHAAIALALRDLQPTQTLPHNVRYIGYCLIDYRAQCKDFVRDEQTGLHQHPVSVIHSSSGAGFVVNLPGPTTTGKLDAQTRKEEFAEALKVTRDYYIFVRTNPDGLAWAPHLFASGIPKLSEAILSGVEIADVPAPDLETSVTLSSMGVVDKIIEHEHGVFRLDDPWVTGEELRTALGCFLSTWRGKLTFSATYNDAWHDKESVKLFLKNCERIVLEGLGVL